MAKFDCFIERYHVDSVTAGDTKIHTNGLKAGDIT